MTPLAQWFEHLVAQLVGNPFHMQDCNASDLEECKQHSVHLDNTVPINGWVGSQAAARHVFSAVQLRLRQAYLFHATATRLVWFQVCWG